MKKLIVLLLVTTQAWAGLPPTSIQGQNDASAKTKFAFQVPNNQFTDLGGVKALVETGNDNLLKNPNFQATTVDSGWSHGASVTLAPDTGTKFGNDPQSIKVTLPAAFTGDAFYQDVPVPSGSVSGVNLESSLIVYNSGNVANLQVCARQGGADVSGSCANVPLGGSWAYTPSAGSGGGSGTTSIGVSLYASASTTGSVWVTHAYVGKNRNIGTVAQAQLIGQVKITGCAAAWSTATASPVVAFATQTGCTYAVSGNALAPATNIPGLKLSSLAPGNYVLKYEGTAGAMCGSGGNCGGFLQFTDGTNTALESSYFGNGAASGNQMLGPSIQESINYTTPQSNVTFQIYGGTNGSAGATMDVFGTTANPGVISVYYYPTQSQTVASLANATSFYTGHIDGSWTLTSATQLDFNAGTGISVSNVQSVNFGTVSAAGSSLPGVTFTPNLPGAIHVCATPVWSNSVQSTDDIWLTDGSGNALQRSANMSAPASGAKSVTVCGILNPTGSGAQTVKVQGAAGGGGTITLTAIAFEIYPISVTRTQPYTPGNISSTGAGMYHTETAQFGASLGGTVCSSTPCSIFGSDTSWLSSVTRSAPGNYILNFASGTFSAYPDCTFSSSAAANESGCFLAGTPTSTTYPVLCEHNASGVDSYSVVSCKGPH